MYGVFASSNLSARQPSMTMVMNRRETRRPVERKRVGARGGAGGQVKNHWCKSSAEMPIPSTKASTATNEPVVGWVTSSLKDTTSNATLGICSRKLPLVGSGFSRTSRQNRVKFSHDVPIRKW